MWRWTAFFLLLGAVFVGLRAAHGAQAHPVPLMLSTGRVVVVGVDGRYELTPGDLSVLNAHAGKVEVAAVSVRPRYIGECAAAGWATLGAGRRTSVEGLCDPSVKEHRVPDWPQRLAAAAARHGDAQLGTLAASVPGCVAAVGPGAALAAARADGTVARYDSVGQFLANGLAAPCPLTLVDPGEKADAIIGVMGRRSDQTLIVTGVGPPAGSHDPRLQVMYIAGSAPAGWLTSASTRRTGVINLSDLTRSLIDFGRGSVGTETAHIDGAPLQVTLANVTVAAAQHHLDAVDALSHAVLRGDLALGICGAALLVLLVISAVKHKFGFARVVAGWACILPAAMMLTGAVPWYETRSPGLSLTMVVSGWGIVLTVIALTAARHLNLPVAVAGAVLTVAAFSAEAALGAVMEPGSMLNSRPVNGGRWYGFGNVTFAVYASATLIVLGYLGHRLRMAGRRRLAPIALAVVGFGVVLCEGWPSMGADFGGVLALTPILLWLVLTFSDVRITSGRVLAGGVAAVGVAGVISWLDWRRGAAARSHLGAFFQRVLDGDAENIIIRKAIAAGASIVTPVGIGSLVIGVAVWIVIFGRVVPRLADEFSTIHTTAVAAVSVAILGTLLNDGGITIWYTMTAAIAISAMALWVDGAHHGGLLENPDSGNRGGYVPPGLIRGTRCTRTYDPLTSGDPKVPYARCTNTKCWRREGRRSLTPDI
jgi:hypothetical protein